MGCLGSLHFGRGGPSSIVCLADPTPDQSRQHLVVRTSSKKNMHDIEQYSLLPDETDAVIAFMLPDFGLSPRLHIGSVILPVLQLKSVD